MQRDWHEDATAYAVDKFDSTETKTSVYTSECVYTMLWHWHTLVLSKCEIFIFSCLHQCHKSWRYIVPFEFLFKTETHTETWWSRVGRYCRCTSTGPVLSEHSVIRKVAPSSTTSPKATDPSQMSTAKRVSLSRSGRAGIVAILKSPCIIEDSQTLDSPARHELVNF